MDNRLIIIGFNALPNTCPRGNFLFIFFFANNNRMGRERGAQEGEMRFFSIRNYREIREI